MKALIQLFYLLHVGIFVEELMWCFNNSFPAAFLQGIIKYELAANLRVAHDNYFYGGFIKIFYTI